MGTPIPDSNYPQFIDDYTVLMGDEVQPTENNKSAHVRKALGGISAIEFTLGVNPQGGYADVVTRLDAMVSAQGNYVLKAGDQMSGNLEMTGAAGIGIQTAGAPQARLHLGQRSTGAVSATAVILGNVLAAGIVGAQSIIAGSNNEAWGANAFAGGVNSQANGDRSFALGFGISLIASDAGAFGEGHSINGSHTMAAGRNNTVDGNFSAVFGDGNSTGNASNIIAGRSNSADGDDSAIFGAFNYASQTACIVAGQNNSSDGSRCAIFGYNNYSSAMSCLLAGESNNANGNFSAVFGQGNTADGFSGFIGNGSGNNIDSSSGYGTIFGQGNTVQNGASSGIIVGDGNTIGSTFGGGSNYAVFGTGHSGYGFGQSFWAGSSNYIGPSGQGTVIGSNNSLEFSSNASVIGGSNNWSRSANNSFIGGGATNVVWAQGAVVMGGQNNNAVTQDSFAGGKNSTASGVVTPSFAWGANAQANGFGSAAFGEAVLTGHPVYIFTSDGAFAITIPGDLTSWLFNGSPINLWGFTGPGSGANQLMTVSVNSVPAFGAGNTTFNINTNLSGFTGGRMTDFASIQYGAYGFVAGHNLVNEGSASAVFGESNTLTGGNTGSFITGWGQTATLPAGPNQGVMFGNFNLLTRPGFVAGAQNSFGGGTIWGGSILGYSNTHTGGDNCFIAGQSNSITMGANWATAIGFNNTVSNWSAAAIGSTNIVSSQYGMALGQNHNLSNGFGNFAAGLSNTVSDLNAGFAIGNMNTVTGFTSGALGNNHNVGGNYSLAIGQQNTVSAGPQTASFVGGENSTIGGSWSMAFGRKANSGVVNGVNILTDSQDFETTADNADQAKRRFQGGWKLVKGAGTDNVDGPEYEITQASVDTVDATVTTIQTIPIPTDSAVLIEARVVGRRTGGVAGAAGDSFAATYAVRGKDIAGTVTEHDQGFVYGPSQDQAWNVAIVVNGTNLDLKVIGAVDNNITWHTTTKVQRNF